MTDILSRLRLLALVPLLVALLPAPGPEDFVDQRFVYETRPPTPKTDPATVWRRGGLDHTGRHECGATPFRIRLEVPEGPIGRFLLHLRRSVLPWSGEGSDYVLELRDGGRDGPVVARATEDLGSAQLLDLTGWAERHVGEGVADLVPTIACTGDGWTYRPDGDWGAWDVEAYHVGTGRHDLGGVEHASLWYENGTDRLEDLKKYDLVVLGEVDPDQAADVAELRSAGVRVAGYVSFSEEHRSDGEPLVGDGRGPGGYDSRYVDFTGADGAKRPDGFPDWRPAHGARNYLTDPGSASWQDEVLERIARQTDLGTDAVFFDTFGVSHPDLEEGIRALVRRVREAFPQLDVVVNSYDAYTEVAGLVQGVLFESFTYAGRGRLSPDDLRARERQAELANALRRTPSGSAFDVIALDYVPDDTWAIDQAYRRADRFGFAHAPWRMVDVNPAIRSGAERTPDGVRITWDVHDAEPDPEELAGVDAYEVRRLDRPITDDDWADAEVVAAGLPPGTRSVVDESAPDDGPLYYGIRAFRLGFERPLVGTPTARTR